MNKTGVKRLPLSKQVADELERMIKEGEYAVGDRIPTEPVLMEMFQVSRNTLREAIHALTSAGMLEVKQGDGTYVRSNSRFNANMHMEYAKVSLEDITEARDAMEVTIARLAARRRTDEDVEGILEALKRRQGLTELSKENTHADVEFHIAIAQASHNKVLLDIYMSIASYMESQIAQRQADTELDWDEIDRLHEELFLAIRDQKADQAVVAAREILNI